MMFGDAHLVNQRQINLSGMQIFRQSAKAKNIVRG